MKKIIIIVALLFVATLTQAVNPVRYYTCDGVNPPGKVLDNMGNYDLTPTGSFNIVNGGAIGKGVEFTSATDQVAASNTQIITGSFTFEFLWKPGHYAHNCYFGYAYSSEFTVGINLLPVYTDAIPEIYFTTNTGSPNQTRTLTVQLNGVGRKSARWILDGAFHHFVFKYNASTGLKQIFIDGESPAGFNETVPVGNLNSFDSNHSIWMNSTVWYIKNYGTFDNLAIYNTNIPDQQVYQDFLDFQAGNNYSFTSNATVAPTSVITSALSIQDFVPGTTLNAGQVVTPCPTCKTPLEQLREYPLARYKISSVNMLKNFQWFDPTYLAGGGQVGQNAASVAQYVAQQTELYNNWNYYLMVNGNVQQGVNYSAITTQFFPAGANLAKNNPKWKTSAITFRLQGTGAKIWDINLSPDHYLSNGTNFVNQSCINDGSKLWSPCSNSLDYRQDGQDMKAGLAALVAAIAPNKLSIINENAEYLQVPGDLSCDPRLSAAASAAGLSIGQFYGKRAFDVSTVGYKNDFMILPQLKSTWFTEYAIDGKVDQDGNLDYRIDYTYRRRINSAINGRIYSTPDVYYRWPYNYRNWSGAWHGWQWVVACRGLELSYGDRLSPFISAGWAKVEEENMRPAQYLGNCKLLAAVGAEFFYAGFFNLNVPFQDPRNWCWQIAIPSYVQGCVSRYWDVFTNGHVLDGDYPRDYTNTPYKPGYTYYNADPRKLIVVRKHDTKNKYAITAMLNPVTNEVGQVEDESASTIYLGADTLTFNVRRNGSIYVYDKTFNPPVFYQVDGWHEYTHPSRWTTDFRMEAENWDNTDDSVRFRLTSGNTGKNYTSFTTVAGTVAPKWPLRYDFQPRGQVNQTYYVHIKAATNVPGTIRLKVTLDDGTAQFVDITGTTLTWYKIKTTGGALSFSNVTPAKHSLKIYQQTLGMRIDKLALTTDSAKNFTD